jgi:hypothetical protein
MARGSRVEFAVPPNGAGLRRHGTRDKTLYGEATPMHAAAQTAPDRPGNSTGVDPKAETGTHGPVAQTEVTGIRTGPREKGPETRAWGVSGVGFPCLIAAAVFNRNLKNLKPRLD